MDKLQPASLIRRCRRWPRMALPDDRVGLVLLWRYMQGLYKYIRIMQMVLKNCRNRLEDSR